MAEKVVIDVDFETNADETAEDFEKIKEELGQIKDELKAIKEAEATSSSSLKKIAKGFSGVGLAIKAMGIGLLMEAFRFLKDILMENQTVVDALNVATTSIGIVFNEVASNVVTLGENIISAFTNPKKAIEDLWGLIKENIINRFEGFINQFKALGKVIEGVFNLDWEKVKEGASDYATSLVQVVTGLDEVQQTKAVEFFKDTATALIETTKEAVKTASEITNLTNKVRLLEAEQQKLMFTYLQEQEIQRQIRDDITKTFAERIQANEKLGESLTKQFEEEKAIVEEKLRLAQLDLSTNEESIEKKEALIQVESELADLNERITGFRSEQLTNLVGLNKELLEAENELATFGKTERELEITELDQWYQQKLDLARRSGQDITKVTEEFEKRQALITKKFQMQKVDAIGQAVSMAGALFKEGTIAQKGFAITSAIIDTYKSANMALATYPPPAGSIIAGLSIATGLANVKKILETKPESDSLPNISNISSQSTGGSVNQGNQGLQMPNISGFNLESSTSMFQQPIQAYVIQQDIEDQTEISTQIQNRATL